MSRQFPDGAGITLAVGSAGVLSGAWTFAAIVKRTDAGTRALLALQASGSNHRGGLWLTSTGGLQVVSGGDGRTFGITVPLDTWVLVAATRVAGANKTPRGHMYRYDTGVWTHAASVTGALGNDTTAIVSVELGRSFADWFFVGLMANAGVWNRALSDVDVEGLELALQAWVDATPVALWPLNQASTATAVQDIIGAADQTSITGTSVSADEPAGWSYTLGGGGSTVSGTATAALGGLTAAAAGDRTVHGAAVASLGGLTATAAGDRRVSGVATASLGALSATATAGRRVSGAATASLGALTGTASGQRTTYATATASLGGLTATASGAGASTAVAGTGLALLAALTATAVGRRTAHGIVATDLGALAATVAGLRTVHGQAVASLGVLAAAVVVVTDPVKADSTATLTAARSSVPSVSAGRTSVATITARRTSTPEVSSG